MIIWQEPPPYIEYHAEAEALARLSLASGACSSLRYAVFSERGSAEAEAFVRRAAIDLVGSDFASSMFVQAIESETAEWEFMVGEKAGLTDEEESARMMDGAEFIASRCARASREYPSVVLADGDEILTGRELIAEIEAEVLAETSPR